MGRHCPIINAKVTYLFCQECEERKCKEKEKNKEENMVFYFITEANNIDYNVSMSPQINTKKEAIEKLNKIYNDIIENIGGEGNTEEASISENGYKIMTVGGDVYYGEIHEVTI